MKLVFSLAFVLACASASAGELMTRDKARIYEKADKAAAVLGEIPANTKITYGEARDYWFHVTVEIGGRKVTGWVSAFDTDMLLGRSKGQLLEENRNLYEELTDLRKKSAAQEAQIKELDAKLRKTAAENDAARAELQAAQKQTQDLRAALERALNKKP